MSKQKAAEAFDTFVDFLESFEGLKDRPQRAKMIYPLEEVQLLILLGVISGSECWVEIDQYGEKKRALLCCFRLFQNGTPSYDQPGDIFALLDAWQFQTCFVAWVASLTGSGPETVRVISNNSFYSPYECTAGEIHIVGRIRWFAREI